MRKQALMTAILGSMTTIAIAQPHHHGEDGVVGVDATGKLDIEMDLDETFEFEELFSGSGLNGHISDAPGFTALDEDEPDEGFFKLGAGADIHFRLVGTSDLEMQVYNPFFDVPALGSGDTFAFGAGDEFDTHPFWFLNTDVPSFDPSKEEWSVQFQVVDMGSTGYADSDVFEIRFAIPAPASASLLGLAGFVASRRRR